MKTNKTRSVVAGLVFSAGALVGLIQSEGWSPVAKAPVPGDVPTYGFGSTGPDVKLGDTIDPVTALVRAQRDVEKFEGAVKSCVNVPLYQHEYDAFIELAYNIGGGAFCGSTLVRKLNAQDYDGACLEILRWDKFNGQPLRGLTLRRQREYRKCIGELAQ